MKNLRSAHPTVEEGRKFALFLDQAAEGFFKLMLGRDFVDIIATAFLRPGHDLSYQHVTFFERDHQVVGMVSCYTADQHHRSGEPPLVELAGRKKLRAVLVSLIFAPLLQIVDTLSAGEFYIQAIAVDPKLRGEGIGTALMDAVEALAGTSGSMQLSLDVSADNLQARKFYEQRGMFVASQWPKRLKIPKFRLLRMTKILKI